MFERYAQLAERALRLKRKIKKALASPPSQALAES